MEFGCTYRGLLFLNNIHYLRIFKEFITILKTKQSNTGYNEYYSFENTIRSYNISFNYNTKKFEYVEYVDEYKLHAIKPFILYIIYFLNNIDSEYNKIKELHDSLSRGKVPTPQEFLFMYYNDITNFKNYFARHNICGDDALEEDEEITQEFFIFLEFAVLRKLGAGPLKLLQTYRKMFSGNAQNNMVIKVFTEDGLLDEKKFKELYNSIENRLIIRKTNSLFRGVPGDIPVKDGPIFNVTISTDYSSIPRIRGTYINMASIKDYDSSAGQFMECPIKGSKTAKVQQKGGNYSVSTGSSHFVNGSEELYLVNTVLFKSAPTSGDISKLNNSKVTVNGSTYKGTIIAQSSNNITVSYKLEPYLFTNAVNATYTIKI